MSYIQTRTCAPPRRVLDETVSPSTIRLKRASTIAEIRNLAAHTSKAKSVGEALALSAQSLADHDVDLPFVLLYALEPDGNQGHLGAAAGLKADTLASLSAAESGNTDLPVWPLAEVVRSGLAVQVDDVARRIGSASCGRYPEAANAALLMPIIPPGADRPTAVLIVGISPRLPINEAYRSFCDLLASGVTTAVANGRAYEDERRRVKALAELDRAKTAFFSNVSHEFRTPLTLMLGPLEDALAASEEPLPSLQRARLEVVFRNALRLQRLVNSLLDFSRIEAGRARATFEPTDLAAFTADLASNFRSACEKAGLALHVDCPPAGADDPVFVDRAMWEKVVLNLLSNAFKFTFDGHIAVSVRQAVGVAELRISDTGTGMPAEDIPRLFDRFHRVENARGRTHEGSGIGLALVQELVKLHGGSIRVESTLGHGSTFSVSIPLGTQHLPADQIGSRRTDAPASAQSTAFVEEALRWLPGNDERPAFDPQWAPSASDLTGLTAPPDLPDDERPLVLVADDNADMRQYLVRLLGQHFRIDAVPDGQAALTAARLRTPDLVLTDVMMPRLDGFGLLHALRADAATRSVPVIMLSARAGEESRVEGMEEGADDYLVKPFSARELVARVSAHLQMARVRREANEAIRLVEGRTRSILESITDGFFALDGNWRFSYINAAGERFLDRATPGDLIGKCLWDEYPGTLGSEFERVYRRVASSRVGESFTAHYPNFDRWYEVTAYPAPEGLSVYFRDVTVQKRTEEDRERLVDRLREEDQRKDEFLATLAHELRNPLAPIRNGLQIMRLAPGDAAATERIRSMMERQLGQMVHLIDDLLDLSRISRGKIDLRKEHIELAKAIQQAIEASRPAIAQADHELVIKFPPDPIHVDADLTRLAQVFANLLNNAAKFTDRGGQIRLTMQQLGTEAVVSIQDNGSGIPARMLPHVFEMFTQVEGNLERSKGGLGIGLSIVKRLVEMHGGSVEARSEGHGMGSEFVVRLPVALPFAGDEPADQPDPVYATTRHRILVVDDNLDAAESLAMMLTMMGNETLTAHDGLEALDVAAAFRPDVMFLDIGMPKLNGYELGRRIRQQAWGKDTVLIALTGWGQEEDKRRSLEAGLDAHLVKPVRPADLEKLLAGVTAVGL